MAASKLLFGAQAWDQVYGEANVGHGFLDVAGFLPGVGVIPGLINTIWYCLEQSWVDCGLSAIGLVPIVGDAISLMILRIQLAPVWEAAKDTGLLEKPLGQLLKEAHPLDVGSGFPAYGPEGGFRTGFDDDGYLSGYGMYKASGELLLRVDVNSRDKFHMVTDTSVRVYGMTDGALHPHASIDGEALSSIGAYLLPEGNR